jgi:hypothetical protein
MQADQFRSALRTRPFEPFWLQTASGAQYTVAHPELANISNSGRTVVLLQEDVVIAIDTEAITEFALKANRGRRKKKGTNGETP